MARSFVSSSAQYIGVGSSPITGPPFAMAGWMRQTADASDGVIGLAVVASFNHIFALMTDAPTDTVRFRIRAGAGGTQSDATTTTTRTVNRWHHIAGLARATNDRSVFIDGGSEGTDTANTSPNSMDRIAIGCLASGGSQFSYFEGDGAAFGLWDLSAWPGATGLAKAAEWERLALPALALGWSPSAFPLGLVAHWRLMRDEDRDYVGGYDMSAVNAPSIATHPPQMRYPSQPAAIVAPSVPPVGGIEPFGHYYRMRRT
jgi:hypothetical protein